MFLKKPMIHQMPSFQAFGAGEFTWSSASNLTLRLTSVVSIRIHLNMRRIYAKALTVLLILIDCLLGKARELWSHLGDGRETMKIKTLIADKQVHAITAHDSVKHLVERLNTFHVGALVVSPDGKVIEGIVSERDIVRSLPGKFDMIEDLYVRDIMTVDVFTCTPDSTVSEIMALMSSKRIRHIPVVDAEGGLISIISIGDVVKHYLNELSAENQALKEYVGTV